MSGIAGTLHFGRNYLDCEAEALLTVCRMRNALLNRGPDSRGAWVGEHAAFGHARLAAADPERQPMLRAADGGEYAIVCDGRLCNADELRRELAGRGWRFETGCDAEIVLASYIIYGEDCAEHLDGAFAFAVWDGPRSRAFLCRDRLGVRPLFWAERGGGVLFASEIKGLLAHPSVRPRVGREGLAEVLSAGPARAPGFGVFEGVSELKPGECVTVSREGVEKRRYWKLQSRLHAEGFEDTARHVRELLSGAVRRRLIGGAPPCALLSGGLGAPLVAAHAARAAGEAGARLPTCSFECDDGERFFRASALRPDVDQVYARMVGRLWDTAHEALACESRELADALYDATRARDLPGMADADASLLLLCRRVRGRHSAALSGACAGEVFGERPWRTDPDARLGALEPGLVRDLQLEEFARARAEALRREAPPLDGEAPEEARRRETGYWSIFGPMQAQLERTDRMSMAAGLEVRMPFADAKLVEYVFNVPWEMKSHGGEAGGLLRAAAAGDLPEEVLGRRGSPRPDAHSPLYEEIVKQRVGRMLDDPGAPARDLLNLARVRAGVEGTAECAGPRLGRRVAGEQLAWILQLNAWLEEYRVELA
ncbi:MAG: asparagine synthase (glutamine-hydrolyzing) [Clostridiales bacterium]|nr:asparagine synthase (glutamine-hydrolyzing) [Clostridiales bacterium]